jgi:AbiJ N-terminal domain 4/Domain of unknown function (DUF7014)
MIFSKRHKDSLKKRNLFFSIDRNTRTRLYRCLQRYEFNIWQTTDDGYSYEEPALYTVLSSRIFDEQGWKYLPIWDGSEKKVETIEDFIYSGKPPHVLDTLEIFYLMLLEHKQSELTYQQDINIIFTEERHPWRMLNGKIFKIDSAYLDEEILAETHNLLHSHGFEGALNEFEHARTNFENGNYRDALTYANHAFESTMKTILGPKYKTKKTGELIKAIQNSEYVPTYLHQLNNFQALLNMPPTIRNNSGGHGSGEEKLVVAPEFAELMMHVCGSLIHFLIKTNISKSGSKTDEEAPTNSRQEESVDLEPF